MQELPSGMQVPPSDPPSGPPASVQPPRHGPHCPQLLHVSYEQGPHDCVAFGVHTGNDGHEQAPQVQLEVHVWPPYVLHCLDEKGLHCAPAGHEQLPHMQVALQVSLP